MFLISSDWSSYFDELKEVEEALYRDKLKFPSVPVYPPLELVFSAFQYFPPEETRVVIIGQDCYHGEGQAMGLCFSVPPTLKIPPSLRNIARELKSDTGEILKDGDLSHWAKQGVLMLNSALTVRHKKPGSHSRYWRKFTDNIVKHLSENQHNLVFLLWGRHAQGKGELISSGRGHLLLKAAHPSPLAANRGGWFGTKHFSKANNFLLSNGVKPIVWGSTD